ncbi:Hypothetical protein A7982_02428 [Minicystis rosea]|nr:Hypothetical protein A7982_02428 [Minicystis rosea]
MHRAARTAMLVVVMGALATREAAAAPQTHTVVEAVRVEPNACFDAASLAPVLARWLKRDAVDRRVVLEITGEPDSAEGLMVRVRRDGEIVGERQFPGLAAPCDEVRAAVGLAGALAIDATVLETLGVTPPPPSPPVAPRWPAYAGSVDAVVLFGLLPAPTAAFAPTFGVRFAPPIELRFSGLISAASTLSLDARSVDVSLLAGRVDTCAAIAWRFGRARACLGLAAGRLHATPAGTNAAAPSSAPWGAALARTDARLSLHPWFGFVLGADAIVPFTRPRFEVVTSAGATVTASNLPVIGAAVTFGPELTFH